MLVISANTFYFFAKILFGYHIVDVIAMLISLFPKKNYLAIIDQNFGTVIKRVSRRFFQHKTVFLLFKHN